MERNNNQQASQRVQDRSMGHPPAPQHQPPPGFPHYNYPSTAQPPIQIPFSDPFRNRDPFMPSSAHGRRGSYGIAPGSMPGGPPPQYGERAWSAQPPAHLQSATQHEQNTLHHSQAPPPPSVHATSLNAPGQMPYSLDATRRSSVGGAGSPPRYPTGQHDPLPPPPPPSFASRTMPPPSPTSGPPNHSFPIPAPRAPPTASPYAGVRDLSGFAPRPGPSMSISSLIGGDSSRHGNHSPRTNATAPSPTIRPIHPPSPQRARSASIRTEQGQYGRPQSPPGIAYASRHSDPRTAPMAPGQSRLPPDHPQSVPPPHPQPFAQQPAAGFRPFQSSPTSIHGGEETVRHALHAPSRPSSQPMHHQPPPEQELRHRQDMYDRAQLHSSFRPFAEQPGRPPVTSQPPPPSHAPPHPSDRPEGLHEPVVGGHSVPPPQHRLSPRLSQTTRSTPIQNGQPMGRGTFGGPFREEQNLGLFRPSYNPYAHHGHREDLDFRGPRNDVFGRPEHRQSPTPSDMVRFDAAARGPPAHYVPPYGSHPYEPHASDQLLRRDGDSLHHRSLLGVSAEMARKNGRSSPLPQAVQGAQLRHVGPAADPNIKSEFGRMFSGLGLGGVGSNTPIAGMSAHGSATPSRMSPARQLDPHEVAAVVADNDGASTESRASKRGRKTKDDGAKDDGDGNDGRNTPTLSHQGSKRSKVAHPAPHHHHHHAHHHHRHHHTVAEDPNAIQPSPFNTLRFPSNPAPNPPPTHHHHHHHAVHTHALHHHHHNPKQLSVPRQPEISVSNQAILSAMSQQPRQHLGTQLYDTNLELPPRDSTSLDAKLHFRSTMKPIPHFVGKENCTFTVRVPRGYLLQLDTPENEQNCIAGGIEEICRTRAVWGTEVYTDDSDVVAAAIHSGWLRGYFGEYDDDIRDVFKEEYAESSVATLGQIITEKPKVPLRPLPNTDLHVTVLLTPPLTKYPATTQHHLRSRQWGSDHDGMSYMIHSIQFTDEGKTNRFTERTAASKHQRIADDLKRRNEAAESLLGLLQGGNSVSVGA